jgi:succinate-semialdehyde dehydrogenase/glutarate-semialdehyde dehydrogenase
LVSDAADLGGQFFTGKAPSARGFWHPPVVISEIAVTARARSEEPFGPIALISRFSEIDEAIAEANRLPFALAAYAFTNDLHIAERLSQEVESGSLAINHWAASFPETPFGGLKDSGFGLEGGTEGVAAFRNTRLVGVASPARSR